VRPGSRDAHVRHGRHGQGGDGGGALSGRFPGEIDGILAVGVLTYEPAFDEVIERGARSLRSGGKWAALDYKMPTGGQRRLAPLFLALGKRFGVSREFMEHRVWEAVEQHLRNAKMLELYGGFVYIASGEAP
jgi:hypothetical protein